MTPNGAPHSNLAIPPGEYLEEVIVDLGMSKDELAQRMNRPAGKLSAIFKGEKSITPETALQIERAVNVPAHIWTGLEAEYRLTLARNEAMEQEALLIEESGLTAKFCYRELAALGEIEATPKRTERVRALQEFFGVMSLRSVLELRRYEAAFRQSKASTGARSPEAIAAWLRLGERRAQRVPCAPYKQAGLRKALADLRAMTLLRPDMFEDRLQETLAASGVALVICPHFPGTKAHGATFWVGPQKAVLMLTIRGKWADIFWFSLFHEIGHLLLHDKQAVILEDGESNVLEAEADAFAGGILIPPSAYARFVQRGRFHEPEVVDFAKETDIDPGIVVGRLQHEKRLKPDWLNKLRVRYAWKSRDGSLS